MSDRAVVLLSGGLDSATTLAIAKDQGYDCHAISFDYGQKQRVELTAAADLLRPEVDRLLTRDVHGICNCVTELEE